MFWQVLAAAVSGVVMGTFTGLAPGIHVNLLAVVLVSIASKVYTISPILIAVVIITAALTHTFLDAVPSIFLGAPDADTVLGVLPGHRMLLDGNGYTAVMLTLIGSLFGLILTICLIPLTLPFLPFIAEAIQPYMGLILIVVTISMLWMERGLAGKLWGTAVFLLSGTLGIIVLNMANCRQPLFCLLSGMFGVSTLLTSISSNAKIPKQKISHKIGIGFWPAAKSVIVSVFAGSLTGLFPGLGAAQASIIGIQLIGEAGSEAFLVLVGGVNTVNFVFSIATLYAIQKARNGAIVAVMSIIESTSIYHLILFLASALFAAGIATLTCIFITKRFAKIIARINYGKMCMSIVALILILTVFFSGFLGILILVTSTAIGILPQVFGVKRSHCMGVLLLPVILYFVV